MMKMTRAKSTVFPAPVCMKLTETEQHRVRICHIEFHPNHKINEQSSDRIYLPLKYEYIKQKC
jgi:hypothetical protein